MLKKATLGMLFLFLVGIFSLNYSANAQTATPSQAVITVSGVPNGTQSLVVEVTVDTSVITLSSPTTDASSSVAFSDSGSKAVGIFTTNTTLPASFNITVPFVGVKEGMSSVAVGKVLNEFGGTEISGASAMVNQSSVSVAAGGPSSGTTGGQIDKNTFTIMIGGNDIKSAAGLNVTLSLSDTSIAQIDESKPVSISGAGIAQVFAEAKADTGIISAAWSGTSTDGAVTITGSLKAGSKAGTATLGVPKVEKNGGIDITSAVTIAIDPTTVKNGAAVSTIGQFNVLGSKTFTGPGKAAVSFTVSGAPSDLSATVNGSKVEFADSLMVGTVIVDLTGKSGNVDLSLVGKSAGKSTTVSLGSISVTPGTGKVPAIKTANALNTKKGTGITVAGSRFVKDATTVTIVPTSRTATSSTAKPRLIKSTFAVAECIPAGSYVNVSTASGTAAKKLKVRGTCANKLVP